MKYKTADIKNLYNKYRMLNTQHVVLIAEYSELANHLESDIAKEYLLQGLGRRLNILKTCIANVFESYPPEQQELISDKNRVTAEINLHCLYLNIYGLVDNCARILFEEKSIPYTKLKEISFENKILNKYLSKTFTDYISSVEHTKWIGYLKNFRHSLSHRIPFYIPPYSIDPKNMDKYKTLMRDKNQAIVKRNLSKLLEAAKLENELCKNLPIITHSFSEKAFWIIFHVQILCDWSKIEEFLTLVFNELKS